MMKTQRPTFLCPTCDSTRLRTLNLMRVECLDCEAHDRVPRECYNRESGKLHPCKCIVCAPVFTAAVIQIVKSYNSLQNVNRERGEAIFTAAKLAGVDTVTFLRTDKTLPRADYGAVLRMQSKTRPIFEALAAANTQYATARAAKKFTALTNASHFSHLRRHGPAILIYKHDSTSPSGVICAGSVLETPDVHQLLSERHFVVHLGPSRGDIAQGHAVV